MGLEIGCVMNRVLVRLIRGQRGFTLVELTTAIAIVGIIVLGITMAISQVLVINAGASNHMIAVRQVQQAGDRVSKDVLQAQTVNYGEDSGFPLILNWVDVNGKAHEVVYTLDEMPSSDNPNSLSILERKHTIAGDSYTRVIARYLDHAETWCEPVGRKLVFIVTARVSSAIETRIYEVEPRPSGKPDEEPE